MKKAISVILCLCIFLNIPFTVYCYSARSMALLESESRYLLDSVDCYKKMPMASTTKIMTALVVLEALPLDKVITVPQSACGVEGSSVYLKVGEKLTVRELLYALMLASGNDAAEALAIAVAGNAKAFATLMNKKAEALGLKNTHFTNPSGLPDDNHYTTAYELALITCHALENPDFLEIVSCKSKTVSGDRYLTNHNKLLFTYEYAVGVKTGYTKKAGRCLVSAAKKDGVTLVCVTLNAPDDWNDHVTAYDFGFKRVGYGIIAKSGDIRVYLDTPDGKRAVCANKNDIYGIVIDGVSMAQKIYAPRFVYAPKAVGQSVGRVTYFINGNAIATDRLLLQQSVDSKIKKQFSIFNFIKGIFK